MTSNMTMSRAISSSSSNSSTPSSASTPSASSSSFFMHSQSASPASGGFLDNLCFDTRVFAARNRNGKNNIDGTNSGNAEGGEFDAHAFVTQTLATTNPLFQRQIEREEREAANQNSTNATTNQNALTSSTLTSSTSLSSFTFTDASSLLPSHTASPTVPLELLREHLQHYQLYIKSELVELLNTEYQDFIGLSSSLNGVDTRITTIQQGLQALVNELSTLHTRLSDSLTPFTTKLLDSLASQRKETYIRSLLFIGEQIKKNDAKLKENEEEEDGRNKKDAIPSAKSSEALIPLSTTHAALISHHLSTAGSHQPSRNKSLSTRVQSTVQHPYDGLKLDLPQWMLRRSMEEDDDEDGEDDGEEDGGNDAFGLYQALLNVPTTNSVYVASMKEVSNHAVTSPIAITPHSDQFASLTLRLIRLERVSLSLASLTPLIRSCSHFNLVKDLYHVDGVSGAMNQMEKRVKQQAKDALIEVLQFMSTDHTSTSDPRLSGCLRTLLRIFLFLDCPSLCEDLVREHFIVPFLKRELSIQTLRTSVITEEDEYWNHKKSLVAAGDVMKKQDSLEGMYARMMNFLRGPFKVLLDVCHQHHSLIPSSSPASSRDHPLPSYSFLTNVFLHEFVRFITTNNELGTLLYSPGIPHVFLDHYLTTRRFLSDLEAFTEDILGQQGVSDLHAHVSWSVFMKKWNLTIYYQLRFQQIALKLETVVRASTNDAMSKQYQPVASKAVPTISIIDWTSLHNLTSHFHLLPLRTLWTTMLTCFDEHVFIDELMTRFVKLVLQCVTRALKHFEEVVGVQTKTTTTVTTASAAASSNTPAVPSGLLLVFYSDWETMNTLIITQLLPLIASKLNVSVMVPQVQAMMVQLKDGGAVATPANESDSDSVLRLLLTSFSPSIRRSEALLSAIHTRLVDSILMRSRDPLQCVPRIATAYRGTRRKLPVHPFGYVRAMLLPLINVLRTSDLAQHRDDVASEERTEGQISEWMAEDTTSVTPAATTPSASSFLTPTSRAFLLHSVLTRLTHEYEAKVKDCLTDVTRFDDLSKKLNRKPTTNSNANEVSDSEKTHKQIELDVAMYASIMQAQCAPTNAEQILASLLQTTRS